jgi:hypothetical protein
LLDQGADPSAADTEPSARSLAWAQKMATEAVLAVIG